MAKSEAARRRARDVAQPAPATNVIALGRHQRPKPPEFDVTGPRFMAAPELSDWFRAVFIDEDGPLANPEHAHLRQATIGVLWTTVGNSRGGRRIVGQAEMGDPMAMGKWAKERARQQVEAWFGHIPDFVMTIDALDAAERDDAEFCALIEHELMHMAQVLDPFGEPKFRKDGRPVFGIRGHDVEEFTAIVRRYGAAAAGVAEFIAAGNRPPEIASVRISQACGTCMGRKAA